MSPWARLPLPHPISERSLEVRHSAWDRDHACANPAAPTILRQAQRGRRMPSVGLAKEGSPSAWPRGYGWQANYSLRIRCVAQSAEHPPSPRLRRTGRPAVVVTLLMAARVWVVPARDAVNVEGRVQIPLAAPILHATEDKLAESPACRAGGSGGSTRRSRQFCSGGW